VILASGRRREVLAGNNRASKSEKKKGFMADASFSMQMDERPLLGKRRDAASTERASAQRDTKNKYAKRMAAI
jgi:hypothetical protein